ncbi:MAG: hypothetical protein HKN23_06260 [Verrucomicrobiales bacterium]|nr:hypothetical protein [Verrucomicrobiales bacterium]
MKLFLDTDILVDMAIDRRPFSEAAGKLLDVIQNSHYTKIDAFVSWSSFLEFSQQAMPLVGQHKTSEFCTELTSFVKIAHARAPHLAAALAFQLPEFRATLQTAAAIACKAELIVTNNTTQFTGVRIPVKAPSALLSDQAAA